MSCSALDDVIDDYCDGRLPADEHAALAAHASTCADCSARLAREEDLRRLLRVWGKVSVPRPDDAWFDATLAAAASRGRLDLRRRWLATACGGLLAAGLAAFLLVADPVADAPAPPVRPDVTLAVATPQTVYLVFATPTRMPGATVTLRLPEGVELDGFPGRRELSWQVDLAAGRNRLPLTLLGRQRQDAALEAILRHGDDSRRFRVTLSVS